MKNLKDNTLMQIIEKPVSSKLVKKILIKNLIINTIFGYYPKEKVQKQKLKFNIKLEIDRKIKFNDNNLNTIVDYDDIMRICLLYTSPSPRDGLLSRMPSSA